MSNAQRIGFAGLGAMGFGMASNILSKHGQLNIIAHRDRTPVETLVQRGATELPDAMALAAASDIVILCLPNSDVVEQIVSEMQGGLHAGQLVIDTGTSALASTSAVAERLAKCGVDFAESPLTGGKQQADAADLGALVGAKPAVFERALPILRMMCSEVQHFGPVGAGARAKFVNNYMVMGIAAVVCEAFHIAAETDIDWSKLHDVVIRGSADSGVFRRIIGKAKDGDFDGYVFTVKGAHKDMDYITRMTAALGRDTPLNKAVQDFFAQAEAAGHGDRLLSELMRPDIRKALFRPRDVD